MTCPTCERSTPDGAAFCPACGAGLGAHGTSARGEERRIVTVLFADLVGFTAMAERLDPEQVKRLIDDCFERLVSDIVNHGGRVDKILGDGILALFGAPIAHEDDAERGVRTGLAMQTTAATYAAEVDLPIQLRVGVTTGEVLVGALRAGGDYTALGDVVNLASRLQGVARPGQVLVGPVTHAATESAIRYEPAGSVTVRGRLESIEAWVACQAIGLPGARRPHAKLPLVGRDEEIAALTDALRLGLRRQRPIVVAIEGEGGIGKSRLADDAVAAMVEELDVLSLSGRCLPYGESAPLAPLAFALRPLFDTGDDGPIGRDAVTEAVTATGSELTLAAERVVDALLHLNGEPSPLDAIDPVSALEEIVRALSAYLAAVARRRPVVVRLSDINWADPLLVEILTRTLPQLASVPLAIVTTARPDETVNWPPRGGHHSAFVLHLDALPAAAAEELVRLLLGDTTDAATRKDLLLRSGGNPLFIEQLAALVGETDDGRVGGELPGTLRGMIAARLDALAPEERAMVDNAAVLGTSGRWKRLEEFGRSMNQRPRRSTLDALTAADLFVVEGNSWRFRSASVRDVAYQMLTKQARAQRHAGVADAVERLNDTGRDPSETLAYHWSQAALLTAELGSVPDVPTDADVRAVRWLLSAAEDALDRHAHGTAERYTESGLGFLDARAERNNAPDEPSRVSDAVSRVQLLVLRIKARIGSRAYDGARADLDAVLALIALSTDEPATLAGWRAEALRLRGMVEHHTGQADLAQSTLQQAVDAFRALGDRHGLADALRSAGVVGILSGRFGDAETTLAEAYDLFTADDDRRGLAWVNQHRAWTAFVRGDVQSADQRLDEAEATFAALGDPSGLGWVRGLRGFVRFHQGRLDDAEALAGAGLREAGERGDKWAASMMQVLLAGLRLWSGRAQDGLELAEKARAGFRSINDRHGEGQAIGPLIRALVALGRSTDAQRELERASAMADSEPQRAWVSLLIAGASAHAGDAHRAFAAAQEALATMGEGMAAAEAWAALSLARLQLGDADRALAAAEAARSLDPTAAYPNAVLAAAAVGVGSFDLAIEAASSAAAHPGSSYLDRAIAASAAALANGAIGDDAAADASISELEADAQSTVDPVCQLLVELTKSHLDRVRTATPADTIEDVAPGWGRAVATMALGAASVHR